MKALHDQGDRRFKVFGLGVAMEEGAVKSDTVSSVNISSIKLQSRRCTFLPRLLRHLIEVVELTIKMVFFAFRISPQVIHCHDVVTLPLGFVVKLFTRAKLVYDAHELESDKNGITPILSKITFWVEQMLFPSVDVFITVSPSIASWYEKNFDIKATSIILNSPYLDAGPRIGDSDRNYLRKRFSIPEKERIFIYVGIFGQGRGIEQVLQAFANIPDIHLVLLGYGALTEYIIEEASVAKNIHYHKAIPHEEVVRVVASADIGLCLIENISLSDYYCLPNKLFEYAFAGIPVVASNFPDISMLVQSHGLGICCSPDLDSIRNAVLAVQHYDRVDPTSLRELSWEHQEDKLRQLYDKLIR
mgnify:CR=1 FL=1